MTTTTVRVSKATHEILQRLARAEGRAIGQVVAQAIDRYDRERALTELNAAYAKLASVHAARANRQNNLTSLEGTLLDGLEDDRWNEDIAHLESPTILISNRCRERRARSSDPSQESK